MQFLQDKDKSLDFNYLMVDGKSSTPNLYVVGNYAYTSKKTGKQDEAGAMMARIDLKSNGLLNTEVKNIGDAAINPLIIVPLENNQSNNEDENAIVRDGDKLLVTSTRGYEVYDPNTLELLSSKKTPGKAKHIALNNGEIAAMYYNTRELETEETPVAGTLEIFNAGADITTAKPEKSIAISEIAPNNGKNTIAIDGDNVYVCRSANVLPVTTRIPVQRSGHGKLRLLHPQPSLRLCQRCDIRRQVCLSGLRWLRSRSSRQEQDGGWQTSSLRQDPSSWYYQRKGKNSLELCQLRNTL